jgi:gamma-glutamylcyclotransferase (GGCT)/AIG2-like uncharacterized protein YtfP
MGTVNLFVYGTLKRGGRNHRLLAGQEFLGEACTRPGYALYHLGGFPGLVRDPENGETVRGELWRVDERLLPRLDAYEGVPDLFVREEIDIEGCAGPVVGYLFTGEVSGRPRCGEVWPPGGSDVH